MKKLTFAVLASVVLCVVGCVSTVTEPNPGSMPAYRDRVTSRYEWPMNEVFAAAKRALNAYGNITAESQFSVGTLPVRTLSGLVNQTKVWMRIEGVTASTTSVTLQLRVPLGGTDLTMAHELEKRIALELTP